MVSGLDVVRSALLKGIQGAQFPCADMMTCPQRSLQVLELKDVHSKQELPEKESSPGMPLELTGVEQELLKVQIVSIKKEFSDLEEPKDGPYLEVNCGRIKEETLKPIHIHRVFPVFGLFSDIESELPDQGVERVGDKEEVLEPIHVHRVFADFGLFCGAQSDDTSGTSGDTHTEDFGTVFSSVPDYSGLWGLSTLPQLSLFTDENSDSIQSKETSRISSSTTSDCVRGRECFNSRNNFPNSKHVETDHRPYLCSICGKTFRRRYHLKSHLSVHLGEKPFHCTRCDKRFTMHRSLERHQQQCTGQVNRRCPFCGDIFRNLSHLQGHMVIHKAEKSYQCNRCGQQYRQSDYLKRHQRGLTEDPPCYCLDCEKTLRLLGE
ncbi:zinc finger protein 850-like [Arapaima gigas]